MNRLRIAVLLVMCVALTAAARSYLLRQSASKPAAEQEEIPKTIAESVGHSLKYTEGNFLDVAEAMPENKYSFVPTAGNFEGARSFGEQVKHVACAQFAFFNEFEGKKPPEDCERGGHDPARTKAELIKYLKDSFDYGNRVLATLNEKNALDRVEGRYAGPNTKIGISVVAVWHITDHYGQIVEYLRMNGMVPPSTQKYGLKVREGHPDSSGH
ncbi:MAG TPA: DinB family protein [Terriglobales bacterium]|nr:DinB family protein [Terriglobales bacterium]